MPQPTSGRIVQYTLSGSDAQAVNLSRQFTGRHGNSVSEGSVYPAMIVQTWGGSGANLQVFLDGDDQYWATSRCEGEGAGFYAWPVITSDSDENDDEATDDEDEADDAA